MKNELIKSTSVYWCPSYDRHILVIKEDGDVVGLNFWQGDIYDENDANFHTSDDDLVDFYLATMDYLNGEDEIERINQAMWAYHSYEILQADRASEKIRQAKLKELQSKNGL